MSMQPDQAQPEPTEAQLREYYAAGHNAAPAKPGPAKPPVEDNENFTHYVHLIDGRVIKARLDEHGLGGIWTDNPGSDNPVCTPVAAIYPRG